MPPRPKPEEAPVAPMPRKASPAPVAAPAPQIDAYGIPSADEVQKRLDAQPRVSTPPVAAAPRGPVHTKSTSQSEVMDTSALDASIAKSKEEGKAYQLALANVDRWMADDDFAEKVRGITYGDGFGSKASDAAKYIDGRNTYLYNKAVDARGGEASVPEAERNALAAEAREQAIRELASLKTVGLWTSSWVLPEGDKDPSKMTEAERQAFNAPPSALDYVTGTIWGKNSKAALTPRTELVGSDSKGFPVYRQESPASYGMGLLSTGITPVVATGLPDAAAQAVFGKRPGAEEAKVLSPLSTEYRQRAEKMLRERRLYSDVSLDTNPETMAGTVAVNLLGITGDVISADPVSGAVIPALTKGSRALGAATRVTSNLERDSAAIVKGLDEVDDLAKKVGTPASLEDASTLATKVEQKAGRTSSALAAEVENRTLAALGDEIAAMPDDVRAAVTKLVARGETSGKGVVGGKYANPQTVAELTDNVLRSFRYDANKGAAKSAAVADDAKVVSAYVDAVTRARSRAIESIRQDVKIQKAAVDTVPKSLPGKVAAFVGDGKYSEALHAGGFGSADAVGEALLPAGMRAPTTSRQVSKLRSHVAEVVQDGTLVLDDAQRATMKASLQKAYNTAIPDHLVPASGSVVKASDLAAIDKWAANLTKPVDRAAVLVPKLTSSEWLTRIGMNPQNIAVKTVQTMLNRVADVAGGVGGMARAAIVGADETRAWKDAGLTDAARKAGIEASRAVEAAVADVAKLGDVDDVAAYLAGTPRNAGKGLSTGGLNHLEAFAQADALGLVDTSARKALATAFVPEGVVLTDRQVRALLEVLDAPMTTPRALIAKLKVATMDVIGSGVELAPGGAHQVGAVVAGYGSTLHVWEKWLGEGVVLTEKQYEDLVSYWTGGVGRDGRTLEGARGASVVGVKPSLYDGKVIENNLGLSPEVGEALRSVVGTKVYVPAMVREQVSKAVLNSLSAPGTTDAGRVALRIFARGVTRGTWITSPRHHLYNYYGDFEQIALSHGWSTAIRSNTEVLLQQLMAVPVAGQIAATLGKGRVQRDILSLPEKASEIVTAVRNAAAARVPALDSLLFSAQTHVGVNAILDGGKETTRLGGKYYTYEELRRAAIRGGVFDSFDVAELARQVNSLSPNWVERVSEANPLSRSVQEVAEGIGERRRVGLYRLLLEGGATPEQAAKGVVDALYDYKHSVADAERGMLRYFLPFWSWQKNANRQMLGAIFTPAGAYRIRALSVAGSDAAKITSTLMQDDDGYGALTGQMPPDALAAYDKSVSYLKGLGLSGPQITYVLNRGDLGTSVAPFGFGTDPSGEVGGEWPATAPNGAERPTADEASSFAEYMLQPAGDLAEPSYYADRPKVRVRAPSNPFHASGKADLSQYYAYLLPPSASEAALNWGGTLTGAVLTAAAGLVGNNRMGERSPVVVAQEVFNVSRSPVLGPVIASGTNVERAGPPTKLKSRAFGQVLAPMELASVPNREAGRYTLEGPLLQAAYTMIPGVQDFDRGLALAELFIDRGEPEQARRQLEVLLGVPSADFNPRAVAGQEVKDTLPALNKIPQDRTIQSAGEQ